MFNLILRIEIKFGCFDWGEKENNVIHLNLWCIPYNNYSLFKLKKYQLIIFNENEIWTHSYSISTTKTSPNWNPPQQQNVKFDLRVYKDPIERLVDVPIKDTYMIQHNNEYQPPTQNKNSS